MAASVCSSHPWGGREEEEGEREGGGGGRRRRGRGREGGRYVLEVHSVLSCNDSTHLPVHSQLAHLEIVLLGALHNPHHTCELIT